MINWSARYTIFTDGSALRNSQTSSAGWACWFPWEKVLRSKHIIGTNNQAELEAIRYALWWFSVRYVKLEIPDNTVYLVTDSEYSINVITGKSTARTNQAKIQAIRMLLDELAQKNRTVKFIHCKSHTNKKDYLSFNNAIVDKEARRRAANEDSDNSG